MCYTRGWEVRWNPGHSDSPQLRAPKTLKDEKTKRWAAEQTVNVQHLANGNRNQEKKILTGSLCLNFNLWASKDTKFVGFILSGLDEYQGYWLLMIIDCNHQQMLFFFSSFPVWFVLLSLICCKTQKLPSVVCMSVCVCVCVLGVFPWSQCVLQEPQ